MRKNTLDFEELNLLKTFKNCTLLIICGQISPVNLKYRKLSNNNRGLFIRKPIYY